MAKRWYSAETCGTYLNVRSEPSTSGEVVGKISAKGTECSVTVCSEHDWFEIICGSLHGYVAARYIYVTEGERYCTVNTQGGSLNIRQRPSTSAPILYTVPNNTGMRYIMTYDAAWDMVSTEKGTGWALDDYILI